MAKATSEQIKVLPAYAGMIPTVVDVFEPDMGAPRVCGDDPGR